MESAKSVKVSVSLSGFHHYVVDSLDEVWNRWCVVGGKLFFHGVPLVIKWIKVWWVPRPVQHVDFLVIQPLLSWFCCMARSIILHETPTAMQLHRWRMVFQHLDIPVLSHCLTFWQEIQTSPSSYTTEWSPNHHSIWVFDRFFRVEWWAAVGAFRFSNHSWSFSYTKSCFHHSKEHYANPLSSSVQCLCCMANSSHFLTICFVKSGLEAGFWVCRFRSFRSMLDCPLRYFPQ